MKIMLKQTICATFVITALLLPVTGQAATYYVATTGSNSNAGTSSKPWRTVAHAVNTMVAGDTTYVKGGVYNEKEIRFKRSGTQSAQIKLLNYPGEVPIIHCIDPKRLHRIVLHHSGGINKPMGWITIEGFEIRNCYNGIKFYSAHDFTVRRNWIHHNPTGPGIIGNGTRVLIDRNRINHMSRTHAIYANGTTYKITNNLIYGNLKYGIQVNGSSSSLYNPSYHPGPDYALSANWIIANNTIAHNASSAGIVVWGSTCNNARIYNNIFYENGVNVGNSAVNGIDFISTTCKGIQIRNNLAYASGAGATRFLGTGAKEGTHYTQSGNIVNTLKPAFVNAPATLPSSPNFALPSGSSAIDKGLAISTAKIAFNGTSRPKGTTYDVGAYEYNGSTSQLLLAAPTSAQAF